LLVHSQAVVGSKLRGPPNGNVDIQNSSAPMTQQVPGAAAHCRKMVTHLVAGRAQLATASSIPSANQSRLAGSHSS